MEFSYRITEADYLAAAKLRNRSMRKIVFGQVMLWGLILVCLMVLWTVVSSSAPQTAKSPDTQAQTAGDSSSSNGSVLPTRPVSALLFNLGPLLLLIAIWIFIVLGGRPFALRKAYRRDPQMRGEITVNITPESYMYRNSAGASAQFTWNLFERWVENKSLILLVMHTRFHAIMNVAALSESQRAELRSILSIALPKK